MCVTSVPPLGVTGQPKRPANGRATRMCVPPTTRSFRPAFWRAAGCHPWMPWRRCTGSAVHACQPKYADAPEAAAATSARTRATDVALGRHRRCSHFQHRRRDGLVCCDERAWLAAGGVPDGGASSASELQQVACCNNRRHAAGLGTGITKRCCFLGFTIRLRVHMRLSS
jgi:hypothetical protein